MYVISAGHPSVRASSLGREVYSQTVKQLPSQSTKVLTKHIQYITKYDISVTTEATVFAKMAVVFKVFQHMLLTKGSWFVLGIFMTYSI